MTFVNHGCNGTSNIIEWPTYKQWVDGIENAITTEQNVTRADYEVFRAEVFDLHHDRHMDHIALTYTVAKRDIKAGEEMHVLYVFLLLCDKPNFFTAAHALENFYFLPPLLFLNCVINVVNNKFLSGLDVSFRDCIREGDVIHVTIMV